ncbi:MAG: M23 family peptidase, partial [Myxococcaceae bacterium]|nr:M23 family peptidase [Myxococcaceae bacterium]
MIRERQRGLLDFLATALCLWAAAYFTPAGALVRHGWHWARGSRSDAKPLIAYYSGGVYESAAPVPTSVEPITPVPVLAAGTPVGKGAFAVLSALPPGERGTASALAAAVGAPVPPLDDAKAGP